MKSIGATPQQDVKIDRKKAEELLARVTAEFDAGMDHLEGMLHSLGILILDDGTLMFRMMVELEKIYLKFNRIEHIPEYMQHGIQHRFRETMEKMAEVQEHAWRVSKAHSREFTVVGEKLSFIVPTRVERRHIRHNTLELDHIRHRIEPLREYIESLSQVKTHDEIHTLHTKINETLQLYHQELVDLQHILREADVLVHRTEILFKAAEKEAKHLGVRRVALKARFCAMKFHRILVKIEDQSRREANDMWHILDHLPKPKKRPAEQKPAEVISLDAYRKKQEELKRAA